MLCACGVLLHARRLVLNKLQRITSSIAVCMHRYDMCMSVYFADMQLMTGGVCYIAILEGVACIAIIRDSAIRRRWEG